MKRVEPVRWQVYADRLPLADGVPKALGTVTAISRAGAYLAAREQFGARILLQRETRRVDLTPERRARR